MHSFIYLSGTASCKHRHCHDWGLREQVTDLFTAATSEVEFNITSLNVPPHGSSMYRISALPSGWIPNTGSNESSLVLDSCGCNPGNPAWKAVDGA